MSGEGEGAMVLQTLKKLVVMVWRIKAERDFTRERHARMEAREHKKQQKLRKKQLKWETKRARQNSRDEQALIREVAKEQAAKRLVASATTDVGARTAKPRRHERVKNACKKLGRAQRELRMQELCYNRSSVQSTSEGGVDLCLKFVLKEQPLDDAVVNEEQQEQQHKVDESAAGSEPVLGSQSATTGLVAWLMAPINWMVARFRLGLNLN
jgi:hypothetical protein